MRHKRRNTNEQSFCGSYPESRYHVEIDKTNLEVDKVIHISEKQKEITATDLQNGQKRCFEFSNEYDARKGDKITAFEQVFATGQPYRQIHTELLTLPL